MRKLRIPLLNRRDLAAAILPVAVLTILAVAFALYFVKPAPPKHLVLASAGQEGRYNYYAKLYQQFLARNGVTLELRPTSGAMQSLTALMAADSGVDVGFIQGGTGYGANAPDLVSLGALYYEPLWVFYRGKPINDLDGLRGRKIAIGGEESGTRALALQLLALNDAVMAPTELLPLAGKEAVEQLLARQDRRVDSGHHRRFQARRTADRRAGRQPAELRAGRGLHAPVPLPHASWCCRAGSSTSPGTSRRRTSY